MAVSKHNLWKRKKNGVMKLVRSHRDWLEKRRETKIRTKQIGDGVHTDVTKSNKTISTISNKNITSSTK